MKSNDFIVEVANIASYNKKLIDTLKAIGFKVKDREKTAGGLSTWMSPGSEEKSVYDIAQILNQEFPVTKVVSWGWADQEHEEVKGPGFKIEKQGRGSIFVKVFGGPKGKEAKTGLDY